MEAKTTREMQAALAKPFAPEDLEWRLQNTNEEKMRGMAVPYVTNRAIQNRLDELQRRFDERASRLSRTRRSLLRGNPTARSAQYDAVLQKLKKHLER